MKRIWAQCIKELAQFRRDRLTVALAFLLPLLTLLIFGFAIRLETKNIPLAIQDFDISPLSRAYIERLFATNQLQPTFWSGSDPVSAINQGIAKAAVVIPPDFSRRIRSGKPSDVQVLVDGTDANNARVIQNSVQATTNFFLSTADLLPNPGQPQASSESTESGDNQSQSSSAGDTGLSTSDQTQSSLSSLRPSSDGSTQSSSGSIDPSGDRQNQSSLTGDMGSSNGNQTQSSQSSLSSSGSQTQPSSGGTGPGRGPNVVARTRIWFNPGRRESLYIVPGVYAVILWIFPSLLTAVAMVREKEQGTLLQVYASSLSAAELLLGKGLAYLLVGLSEAAFIIILGSLIFRASFAGDPTPLLIGTPIYLAVSILFGLLIGIRAANQNAAVQAVALVGFLSAFLLSGFIYPLSNIPFPLSWIANIIPARYYIEITRDAFVRGIGWVGVGFSLLMIAFLGFLLFNAARRALGRMQLPD
jgi:ABC-2 type transport system permease protein